MPKIWIDPLAIKTFQRLAGVRAFIELLDKSLPEAEWREREALDDLAREQGWDIGDYSLESDVLDEQFRHWMPRLSAYSVITILQSVVETQLFACAKRVGKRNEVAFQVRDIRGGVLESAVVYLRKAGDVDVTADPVWPELKNLQQLRNIIVHRGGTRGDSEDHQKAFDSLVMKYTPDLSSADRPDWLYGEMWISLPLCRQFIRATEAFFSRILRAIGVPEEAIPRPLRNEGTT